MAGVSEDRGLDTKHRVPDPKPLPYLGPKVKASHPDIRSSILIGATWNVQISRRV